MMNVQPNPDILRIALVGYGQMGHEIERLGPANGAEIVARYSSATPLGATPAADFDVAIEFTRPDAAVRNIETIIGWGKPVVVGTTGWLERIDDVRRAVEERNGRA